jgi:hypothetical protein
MISDFNIHHTSGQFQPALHLTSQREVAQLAGKKARLKEKKEREKALRDQRLSPEDPDLKKGLKEEYTSEKLNKSELMGGHGRERHAEKDQVYLQGRNLSLASTFNSQSDQDKALEQLIEKNRTKIEEWIGDPYQTERLTISGEIQGVNVTGERRQRRTRSTSSGYEYPDPTIPPHVTVHEEALTGAVAVLEPYLEKTGKKGESPRLQWRVVTCYPAEIQTE